MQRYFVSPSRSSQNNRALPWDPNIGEEAGEMDSFVKYLVMRLRNSLVEKSGHYALEPGAVPEVRAFPFVVL